MAIDRVFLQDEVNQRRRFDILREQQDPIHEAQMDLEKMMTLLEVDIQVAKNMQLRHDLKGNVEAMVAYSQAERMLQRTLGIAIQAKQKLSQARQR